MKITGFDGLAREMRKLERNAAALQGTHSVPLSELLSDAFVRRHTSFGCFQALCDAAGLETQDDLGGEAWNTFVAQRTRFSSWEEMKQAAGTEWVRGKLGFK